jgi:hypothetical protein
MKLEGQKKKKKKPLEVDIFNTIVPFTKQ